MVPSTAPPDAERFITLSCSQEQEKVNVLLAHSHDNLVTSRREKEAGEEDAPALHVEAWRVLAFTDEARKTWATA